MHCDHVRSPLIDELIDARCWDRLGAILRKAARDDDPRAESMALTVVARGQLQGLHRALGVRPHAHGPALLRILAADASARAGTIALSEIDELIADVRASAPYGWELWARAVKLESFMWRGDGRGVSATLLATPACLHLSDQDGLGPVGRMARARLLRTRAFAETLVYPESAAAILAACTAADDLLRLGCVEGALVTRALFTYAEWVAEPRSSDLALRRLEAAAVELQALGADSATLALGMLGWVATASRRLDVARRAFDGLSALCCAAAEVTPPAGCRGREAVQAVATFLDEGPTPDTVGRMRATVAVTPPSVLHNGLHEFAAGLLIDHGFGHEAGTVLANADPVRAAGMRATHDTVLRRGPAFAEPCSTSSVESENRAGVAPVRPGMLRLLGPDVVVERCGRKDAVSHSAALLLARLVAARDVVLPTGFICETMWPDADFLTAKERLSSLLWRIRRALALGRDELLVRTDAGIRLDAVADWRIDAWDFTDLARAPGPERFDALALYGGDLCYRQLAYVDCIETYRASLHNLFVKLLRDAVESGAGRQSPTHVWLQKTERQDQCVQVI